MHLPYTLLLGPWTSPAYSAGFPYFITIELGLLTSCYLVVLSSYFCLPYLTGKETLGVLH